MPINITGEFQPSDGAHGFDLYDPQDIKAGDVNVQLQAVAGGKFRGGSHATAPVGEVIPQVKTTTGAPTHSATEGTICWNSVDNILYVNNNGATGWSVIGVAGDADQSILPVRSFTPRPSTPPRLKAGANITITQRADEFEVASTGGGTPGDSDQSILPRNVFSQHPGVVPRLKAGTNVVITRRADEFEVASPGDSDQAILPGRSFSRSVGERPGGPTGAIQFNNSGILGGTNDAKWNGTGIELATSRGVFFRSLLLKIYSSLANTLDIVSTALLNLVADRHVFFSDATGETILEVEHAGGVSENYLQIKNAATASDVGAVPLNALGGATTVHLNVVPQGAAGRLQVNGDEVATIISGQIFGA